MYVNGEAKVTEVFSINLKSLISEVNLRNLLSRVPATSLGTMVFHCRTLLLVFYFVV